ncbi:arylamine N-acetyltransferase family protein [Actinophytocola sediminis]
MLDDAAVGAYLDRIGARRPVSPTGDALRELHGRHVLSVPFENIDFGLGKAIDLGADALGKIVGRRRGGCCYELNTAFTEVLLALGYRVTVLSGRVVTDGAFGHPFGHLAMRVVGADSPRAWLVDVGYGRCFRYPLRLDSTAPQEDPHGTYQVRPAPHGDLDLFRDGHHQYRLERRARTVADFAATIWWFRSAADSPFLARDFCTLPTATGRVTVSGDTLIRREHGIRTTQVLAEADVRAAYRTWFGFDLDELPRPAARLVGGPR